LDGAERAENGLFGAEQGRAAELGGEDIILLFGGVTGYYGVDSSSKVIGNGVCVVVGGVAGEAAKSFFNDSVSDQ